MVIEYFSSDQIKVFVEVSIILIEIMFIRKFIVIIQFFKVNFEINYYTVHLKMLIINNIYNFIIYFSIIL